MVERDEHILSPRTMENGYSTPEHVLPSHHTHGHILVQVDCQSQAEILILDENLVLMWLLVLNKMKSPANRQMDNSYNLITDLHVE